MKTTVTLIAVAATAMTASAQQVLSVDLTVANQLTISTTGAASANSGSGSTFTGFLLADLLNTAGAGPAIADGVGDLTTANNASDFGPSIFNGITSFGINVWSYTPDATSSVTAGQQAFDGSATWTVDAGVYASLLAGNLFGDVYLGADTDDDIGNGTTFVGTWAVVPAPSSLALLGLGGVVAGRRRR